MKKIKWIVLAVAVVAVAGIWGKVLASQGAEVAHGWGDITVVEAPEQTQSQEHPLFIKEVYEPVIPEGENIVRDAKIEDNGYNDVYNARKVKDGNVNGQSYWEGVSNAYPNTLTAAFEEDRTVHAMKLMLCPKPIWSARTQSFSVDISTDGENFTEFMTKQDYEFTPDRNNEVVLKFDEITVRAIRLNFYSNTGAEGAQIAEWEIYSVQE